MLLSQALHRGRHMQITLPVLMKEMRVRMRGARTPAMLFISTAAAISIGLIIIGTQWGYLAATSTFNSRLAELGRQLMLGLMSMEFVLCALITPALTAGAFSIEQEQQTLDLLLITPLSSKNIVLAKLLSAAGLFGMILLSVVPVAAISFVFGGVSPWQFVLALLLILAMAACFSAIGLLCSLRFLKTPVALTLSYCICMGWLVALPLLFLLLQMSRENVGNIMLAVALASATLLVLATIPTVYTSLLVQFVRRQRVPRVTNMIIWGAYASGASLLLYLPHALDIMRCEYFLFANPALALYIILQGDQPDGPLSTGGWFGLNGPQSVTSLWFAIMFVAVSILLLHLGAWSAFKLAERELEHLRKPKRE